MFSVAFGLERTSDHQVAFNLYKKVYIANVLSDM